ncbi:MAG: Tfp pilus assembly protein PilF [Algoriphagus sp.]
MKITVSTLRKKLFMGNLDRIKLIKQFTEDEPENPFNWYALALEYREIDPNQTEDLFSKLLQSHKSYLPTYFPAAHFFAEDGQIMKAQEIFLAGIEVAKADNNQKTLKELKNAYLNFCFENDLDD